MNKIDTSTAAVIEQCNGTPETIPIQGGSVAALAWIEGLKTELATAEAEIARLRDALPRAWESIETAPKDGRTILLCKVVTAHWSEDLEEWMTTQNSFIRHATHWTLSPTPPADLAKGGDA